MSEIRSLFHREICSSASRSSTLKVNSWNQQGSNDEDDNDDDDGAAAAVGGTEAKQTDREEDKKT